MSEPKPAPEPASSASSPSAPQRLSASAPSAAAAGQAWNGRLLAAALGRPWALRPDRLADMSAVLLRHARGIRLSADEISAAIASVAAGPPRERTPEAVEGSAVAVINVFGILTQRINMMDDISCGGGTSTEMVGQAYDDALAHSKVGTIVLNIDSPGGDVYGIAELADKIFAGRARKKTVAIANSQAASGALWLGTAASEFVITPGGEAGSVGVWAEHLDVSEALAMEGYKPTLISAGKYKVEGNPYEPLSDEARATFQKSVDEYYAMFVNALARNRNTTAETVEKQFGQGRMFRAEESVARGLADRVESFDDLVRRLLAERASVDRARAASRAIGASMALDGSENARV